MRIAAAVASGALVAGLFPPFSLAALAWVALVPLLAALWSVEGKRAGWRGFFLGWLAGTVSFAIQFSWLGIVSTLGVVVLPLYLGLFWGAFGAFAATLGVAFHETPVIAQAADLLGVAGLSMLTVFFQAVLVQTIRRMIGRKGGAARWLDFAVAAMVVGMAACYGIARMKSEKRIDSVRLKALLVQINIPQDAARVLWEPIDVHMAYEDETLSALEKLAAKDGSGISNKWPDWVMWPESALTGRIMRADDGTWGAWQEDIETIAQVHAAGPFQLIYGTNELESEKSGENELVMKEKGRAWNSLAVMSPRNELQTYRKRHLVIFGETIPFVDSIPLLKKIYEQQAGVEYGGSFTPGVSTDPLPIPTAADKVIGAIPTICFEDTVARITRLFLRPGPQVIVNVTNDGWFKESAAAAQHFANARFRAIELRRPMLRCANTGVSAAIDTTGSTAHPDTGVAQEIVDAKGSHFTRGSRFVELNVPLKPSFSLYALIGDWGVIGLSLMAVALAWAGRRQAA